MNYLNLYKFVIIFINLKALDSSIISNEKRERRYLVFPPPTDVATTKVQLIAGLGLPMNVDVSTIIGYVVKFNYFLPYNASYMTEPYVRYERSIDDTAGEIVEEFSEKNSSSKSISRWNIYEMIESSLGALGSGRSCLLRMICEAAGAPFSTSQGIFSQLLHVLFTPSSTAEEYENVSDQEYHAAESYGRKNHWNCPHLFSDCPINSLDYFSLIVHD